MSEAPHSASIPQSQHGATSSPSSRTRSALSLTRILLLCLLYCCFLGAGTLFFAYHTIAEDLPDDLHALREPPSRTTRVWSADGHLIGEFFIERRVVVPLSEIPEHVKLAFVAAEDRRFQTHPGFDPIGIVRAAYVNFHAEKTRQGASTITQQLTRLLMLSNERSYYRKLKELILSVRVENQLTKNQILEMYLNRVFLGTAHGVESASQSYFGKTVGELTVAEGALLAGLVQRPSGYAPHRNLAAAKSRQRYVLERMVEDGHIDSDQFTTALAEPTILVHRQKTLNHVAAPYFVEHVRKWAQERYGARLFSGGFDIHTTIDSKAQHVAESAVRRGLENLARRREYTGPIGHFSDSELRDFRRSPPARWFASDPFATAAVRDIKRGVAYTGVVISAIAHKNEIIIAIGDHDYQLEKEDAKRLINWQENQSVLPASPTPVGDVTTVELGEINRRGKQYLKLSRQADAQAALVAFDPHEGTLQAMVGGYNYADSQFNRAVQAKRQIGSAMKPFIYAAAIEQGATHLDMFYDGPIAVRTETGGLWSPKNYNRSYLGPITLRTAMAKSINTVAVRLAQRVGIGQIIRRMRDFGIVSRIPQHISVALGTADLSLWEVTAAMGVFANGGKRLPSQDATRGLAPGRFIDFVENGSGEIVEDFRNRRPSQQVIDRDAAYLTANLMQAVVERGTGRRAKKLGRPAAGKTGTSSAFKDAWFIGFTRDRIAGVWVGRDDSKPLGYKVTGGNTALPIWNEYMAGSHPDTPPEAIEVPPGITFVRANDRTGAALPPGTKTASWVPFERGTVPARFARTIESSRFDVTWDLFKGASSLFSSPPNANAGGPKTGSR